jgi:hypothetical protein
MFLLLRSLASSVLSVASPLLETMRQLLISLARGRADAERVVAVLLRRMVVVPKQLLCVVVVVVPLPSMVQQLVRMVQLRSVVPVKVSCPRWPPRG